MKAMHLEVQLILSDNLVAFWIIEAWKWGLLSIDEDDWNLILDLN